jgi:hypothetical protein
MRGAPHNGLASEIVRISARTSADTVGLPMRRRLFHAQNKRKPRRCHAMTVSGCTMTSAVRQFAQTRDSQTQRHRSTFPRASRCGCDRCSTCSWWCNASTSRCSAIRDRIVLGTSGRPKSAQSASPRSLFFVRRKCNDCNTNGLFSRDSTTRSAAGMDDRGPQSTRESISR